MTISHRFTFVALLATLFVGTGIAFSQRPDKPRRTSRRTVGPKSIEDPAGRLDPGDTGDVAMATSGKIPVLDVLRTVGMLSDKVLLYPTASDDPMFRDDVTIELLEGIDRFSVSMGRALLESNGYQFYEEELADGQVVLHVRHMHSRNAPPPPKPSKIYGPDEEIPAASPYRFETAIIAIQHADPSAIVSTLRNHLQNLEGSRTQQIAAPGGSHIMVTGTRRMLRHVRELCNHLDVSPYQSPKPETPKKTADQSEASSAPRGQ